MQAFVEANKRFENPDYRRLGEIVYGLFQGFCPSWQKGVPFEQYWAKSKQVVFAWEIIQILNEPDISVDELWNRYYAITSHVPLEQQEWYLKEDVYKSDPELWVMIKAVVNAMRHTIKPARCSY
ncbi:hypothetical protein [Spirosoma oryzicola]|uniref:hypothetical protein n=1 Tax=Spirosoma oryzicola TaxID=2898794 RepID=UPI001E528D0D|nr:hypothetical protein [Spirosoma oryzicola]UHG93427.1 hypothetical protein LQ777_11095 [Spirosoma oryzicola]